MTKAALSSRLLNPRLNPRPPARQTGTLPTELTRRPLINQHWSNIQSKNYGYNSQMSQECTETLCSFHVKGTKWNRKQIKPFYHQRHFVIFFEPAIVISRYIACALFKARKNWVFKKPLSLKKNPWILKKIWGLSKKPEFWKKKNLSLKKTWVLKKNLSFEKI